MVGWHHRHNGHGFGWTPGAGDGQGGLVYCSSWGRKESDTIERLNWTEKQKFSKDFKKLTTSKTKRNGEDICDCQRWGRWSKGRNFQL